MAEPQNGRIGGGVLSDNLLRQGIDLNFKNTSSDTALLHLDVNTNKIGVNIESPSYDLHVVDTLGVLDINSSYLNVPNFTIQNSEISVAPGNFNLNAGNKIFATSIKTDDIKIDFNTISTTTPNTNIEFRTNGTGSLDIHSNWNITGSLHSTGNITFGNNFTIGNDANDSLDFNAEIQSDIIPDTSNTYNLGQPTKQWKNIYSNLLNGRLVVVDDIEVGDTSLALRQGNIFYVSTLGDDTNVGDHQHGAFRTIRHALEVADASSGGPVTIHVFPGEYEETFPLVVPERVTISGEDIRNTFIIPDTASQFEDVFHLNQNTTIENITIRDFYYDSLNDTGYAFSFAPGAVITERSPYIRNVTVITEGSVISGTDPRGFAAGDAGKGALIDGAVIDSASTQASMLFHSATFITPGVDCITMTNGVRVEWLNSFTYFANRGLYATQGTGRTLSDGSTIEYGAEIRSIGSANIYGNYGAVADGADTLMYLIGHNFAYIGTGKDVSNDRTLTLQDQETLRLNNGRIYYTSTDADGTFRVGNAFYVDFETGSTSINADAIDFSGVSSIFINTGGSITYIDGSRIDIGNIRFSGNTIYSLNGDIIWSAATGFVNFDTNAGFVIAKGNNAQRPLEESDFRYNTDTNLFEGFSSANTSFGGIWSDDRQTSVSANNVLGDIVFRANTIETARISGDTGGRLELNGLTTGDIYFDNNLIRTTTLNSDLDLRKGSTSGTLKIFNLNINEIAIDWATLVQPILSEGVSGPDGSPISNFLNSTNSASGHPQGDLNLSFDNFIGSADALTALRIAIGTIDIYNPIYSAYQPHWFEFINALTILRESDPATYNEYFFLPDSNITNTSNNDLSIESTNRGYVKFDTTGGIVIPVGNDSNRPTAPTIGTMRWNTDAEIMEIYTVEGWIRTAGEGSEVTEEVINELLDLYVLVLG